MSEWLDIMRYFFHATSSWAEEAIRYSIIWVTFIGGSQCAKQGSHVGIDLVVQFTPAGMRRYLQALGQFIAAAFTLLCLYAGYQATSLIITTSQRSPAMLMPMWIVYISIPIGCALMTIRFIVAGIAYLRDENSNSLIADEDGNVDLNKL